MATYIQVYVVTININVIVTIILNFLHAAEYNANLQKLWHCCISQLLLSGRTTKLYYCCKSLQQLIPSTVLATAVKNHCAQKSVLEQYFIFQNSILYSRIVFYILEQYFIFQNSNLYSRIVFIFQNNIYILEQYFIFQNIILYSKFQNSILYSKLVFYILE